MIEKIYKKTGIKILLLFFIIITAFIIPLFTCTDHYNPFTDTSNAGAQLEPGFKWGDTLEIFQTESLHVKFLVRELIDSVKLSAPGNRLWQDTLLSSANINFKFTFALSFNDTGVQNISVSSYIKGGSMVKEEGSIYLKSPLRMDSLRASSGYPFSIEAPPVSDENVLYHWDIGNIVDIEWWKPETTITFYQTGHSDSGSFWVTDNNNLFSSPKCHFYYSVGDTTGPLIFCINKGFLNKDTIFTGDTLFYFRVHISDKANSSIYQAEINGVDFPFSNPPDYLYPVDNADTISGFLKLSVAATDDIRTMNRSEKIFYLGYDPELEKTGGEAVILNIDYPSASSLFNSGPAQDFYGTIDNYTDNRLSMDISLGNSAVQTLELQPDSLGQDWYSPVQLEEGENTITFSVYDSTGIVYVSRSSYVFHDPLAGDTSAPSIVKVFVNNRDITSSIQNIFPNETLPVRVIAFDRGSGLSIVTCNESPMKPEEENGSYIWTDTINISRNPGTNNLEIIAKDSAGLSDSLKTVITYNRPPVITKHPAEFKVYYPGRLYRDTILFVDPDGDDISVTAAQDNPSGISYTSTPSAVYTEWNTSLSDTGNHSVSYTLFDSYNSYVTFQWNIEVSPVDSSSAPVFSSQTGDMTQWIDAGDTLVVPLSVSEGTGTPPFTFRVNIDNTLSEPVITDDTLYWQTTIEDSGYHLVTISVLDKHNRMTSLKKSLFVATSLHSPSVGFDFSTVDTLENGAIDLHTGPTPDTLYFNASDMDNNAAEEFSIEVSSSRNSIAGNIDSTGSFHVILASSENGPAWDTITVTVTDRSGDTGIFSRPVYYGSPPDRPEAVYPSENGEHIASDTIISWSCTDPDGDTLTYDLFIDTTTVFTAPVYSGKDSAFSLSSLSLISDRIYYWKVAASDGRNKTESAAGFFTTGYSRAVKVTINTSASGADISSPLYDFPLLLRLTEDNFPLASTSYDGNDIRVRKSDGSLMNIEIEMWDKTNGTGLVWVRMDTIYANNDVQHFFIYTGQSNSPAGSDGSGVFNENNGYIGVWHLSDNNGGTVVSDATGSHDGAVTSSVSEFSTSARVGRGFRLDQISQEVVTIDDHPDLDLTGNMTIEGWIYIDTLIPGIEYGIVSKMNFPEFTGYNLIYDNNNFSSTSPGTGFRYELLTDEETSNMIYADSSISAGEWHYVAGSYDNSVISIYLDGRLMDENFVSDSVTTNDVPLLLGSHYDNYYNGIIDEVRISGTARSGSWIKLCWINQNPESSFITYE